MLPALSREQSRDFDRQAIGAWRVAGLVLMENAGRGACEVLLRHFPEPGRVLVVCGLGNNGGDGYVVARRLLTLGHDVQVVALAGLEKLPPDARSNAESYLGLGGRFVVDESNELDQLAAALSGAGLVVDALFGTGLTRPIAGRFARAVEAINASDRSVVALDLPSGLDANTGQVHGVVLQADVTATFAAYKLGLLTARGRRVRGRVEVVDIGVPPPPSSAGGAVLIEASDVRALMSARPAPCHKGDAGRVVLVAGSSGKLGAARLAARGAHRAGAGLVTIASFEEVAGKLDQTAHETMTLALPRANAFEALEASRADVLAIGPGLGLDEAAAELIEAVVERWPGVVVVDADALTHYSGAAARFSQAAGPRILTPHPAEAARLLGVDVAQVQADRFLAVRRLSAASGAVVLLKGVHTLVAEGDQPIAINTTGNSALSSGGSGDVLTGVIAALAAHLPPRAAAVCGAWLHGAAAERWSDRSGATSGMLAREAADLLPEVMGTLGT